MRPAAPVRLGRGGEPPGLISPSGVFPSSRDRQAPAPGSMDDPHDDTDVPSGTTDGAQMESTSPPVLRLDGVMVIIVKKMRDLQCRPQVVRRMPPRAGRACGVPQFQLPQRTPGQTRQARDGRRGPPGGAWAGPGAHCGVGPAWVLGLFIAETPSQGARWSAKRHSLSRQSQVATAPYCALLSAQPRPAAGRATPWPGPPCDRPPKSVSVEEASRLA